MTMAHLGYDPERCSAFADRLRMRWAVTIALHPATTVGEIVAAVQAAASR
ncbi:hypothetical protein [Azospirillum argentinense]|nr:hypothetical protein [Azospirillum argentinense]